MMLMKQKNDKKMIQMNKRLIFILAIALFLLLLPAVGMLFTNGVNWTLFDFAIAGGLLFSTGFVIELMMRKIKPTTSRMALGAVVLLVLALIWIELAVGLFGTPFAGS